MAKRLPELVRRERAADYVRAKYAGRACDFKTADCIRMARTLLAKAGHKMPPLPRYSTQAGALRALKRAGFANLIELFDSLLPRIPSARMLLGDIAVVADEDGGIGAAVILFQGGVMLGWHEEVEEAVFVIAPPSFDAAWRI